MTTPTEPLPDFESSPDPTRRLTSDGEFDVDLPEYMSQSKLEAPAFSAKPAEREPMYQFALPSLKGCAIRVGVMVLIYVALLHISWVGRQRYAAELSATQTSANRPTLPTPAVITFPVMLPPLNLPDCDLSSLPAERPFALLAGYQHSIILYDLQGSMQRSMQGSPCRLTTLDAAYVTKFALSPEHDKVAYVLSNSSSSYRDLVIADIESPTSVRERLRVSYPVIDDVSWSPDGSQVLFDTSSWTQIDLMLLDVASGEVTRLPNTETRENNARWLESGHEIAYLDIDLSGTGTIQVVDLDAAQTTRRIQSFDVAGEALESSFDGAVIALQSESSIRLFTDTDMQEVVLQSPITLRTHTMRLAAVSPDGSQLIFRLANRAVLYDVRSNTYLQLSLPRGVTRIYDVDW